MKKFIQRFSNLVMLAVTGLIVVGSSMVLASGASATPPIVPGVAAVAAANEQPVDLTDIRLVQTTPPPEDQPEDPNLQCGTAWTSLNWWLCPITQTIRGAVGWLDSAINGLLSVNSNEIFNTNEPTGRAYHTAWESFRAIALGVLVVAAIAMVISQALGFEFLDAYTIKKIFPRLIVAIIGIALSWEIMRFFVDLTNDLGFGVRAIIYYPFRDINDSIFLGGGASAAAFILSLAGLHALGIMGLLSFVATAFLAVIIAFLVLIVRQLVIVLLILLAPIAIACYILPNTDGVWKFWKDSFTKVLLMFPIIVAFLAVGRVFALTATSSNAGEITAVSQIIGFAAYFMPYFLIPLTFRFAGGVMRTLGGFMNDKGRGGFDRLKKYRQGKVSRNMADTWSGNRYKGDNPLGKRLNATTGYMGAMAKTSMGVNPKKWGQRVQATQSRFSMAEAAEYSEKNAEFGVIKQNDDFLQAALKFGKDEEGAKKYLTGMGYSADAAAQGVAAIRAARRQVPDDVFETAAAMALPATGTAFKTRVDENGNVVGGAGEMHELINTVAGDDRVKAGRMLAAMRSGASSARRFDLAGGGFGDQIKELENQYNESVAIDKDLDLASGQQLTVGRTAAEKQRLRVQSRDNATETIIRQSLEGQGGAYIAQARKTAVENFAPVMMKQLNEAIATGDQHTIERELAALAGRYDAMMQVSPENAKVLADNVLGVAVTVPKIKRKNPLGQTIDAEGYEHVAGQMVTVRNLLETARTRPAYEHGEHTFLEMRKEYGSSALRGAAAQREREEMERLAGAGPVEPPQRGPLPPPGT